MDLARVLDPASLDASEAGRFALDVLPEWLDKQETIAFVVPRRVTCARCDGGGCDACARSGAFRVEGDDAARTLHLTLPAAPAVVRMPFAQPAILLVELRPASAPTAQVVPKPRSSWWWLLLVLAVALLVAYSSCHAPSV